jgi:cell division protease FtsH
MFSDIGGYTDIKNELSEIIENTTNNTQKTNITGIILYGPPGTGKTYFAQAIAAEKNLSFAVINSTDIYSSIYIGEAEIKLKQILNEAKMNTPSIVFIDEIENLISARDSEKDSEKTTYTNVKNILLTYMDGTENMGQVIIIGASNNIKNIDKAFLRPGRFEHIIAIDLPSYQDRLEIIKILITKKNLLLNSDITLDYLAERTANFTAAELNKLFSIIENINKKNHRSNTSIETFTKAYLQCTLGKENKHIIVNNNEKRNTAIHEAGHALLEIILNKSNNNYYIFDFVTISPRGLSLGASHTTEPIEYKSWTKEDAKNRISVLLAGRIAQEIILNQIDEGASNDLEKATLIAKNMITKQGFGKKISQIHNKKEVINEANDIIETEYKRVTNFFKQHKALLLLISDALVKKETLYKKDIKKIVNTYEINNKIKLLY